MLDLLNCRDGAPKGVDGSSLVTEWRDDWRHDHG